MIKPNVIIPARAGSKRFPDKNLILWEYTSKFLKENSDLFNNVYVSTDSNKLSELVEKDGFCAVHRCSSLSIDELPVNPVIGDVIAQKKLYNTTICMMYLTSPERFESDFRMAIKEYSDKKLESLVSFYRPKYSPYLAKFEDNLDSLINSSAYRYQDYRNVVVLQHYVCLFEANSLWKLDNQLFNQEITKPFILDHVPVDIDYQEQLRQWLSKKR